MKNEQELLDRLNADASTFFAAELGLRFVEATLDRVVAELTVDNRRLSRPDVMHGGALMAFADTVGGFATRINLAADQRTTTIESKTNFFRAARPGTVIRAEATALHKGKTTLVWQTRILDQDGALIAQTVQTQLVVNPERP